MLGRFHEAALLIDQAGPDSVPTPGSAYSRVVTLWAANRLDDADRAMEEAFALFPLHFAVWFTRFYLLMYTGRIDEAIGFGENIEGRPAGIPEAEFAMILQVARAMRSRVPAEIDAAIATIFEAAHHGAGYAENSMQFAAALGRVDTSFAIADAYYFARGFDTGDLRFSAQQRVHTRRSSRRTRILFVPSTAAMRVDRRFRSLTEELGLERYWRSMGVLPDYRRG